MYQRGGTVNYNHDTLEWSAKNKKSQYSKREANVLNILKIVPNSETNFTGEGLPAVFSKPYKRHNKYNKSIASAYYELSPEVQDNVRKNLRESILKRTEQDNKENARRGNTDQGHNSFTRAVETSQIALETLLQTPQKKSNSRLNISPEPLIMLNRTVKMTRDPLEIKVDNISRKLQFGSKNVKSKGTRKNKKKLYNNFRKKSSRKKN
jgi:hypothetical protein